MYGCCKNKVTAKIDQQGSNCPNSEASIAPSSSPTFQQPIPGGYSPFSTDDPTVIAATDFALRETFGKDTFLSYNISKASTQVVNGINYKLVVATKFKSATLSFENCTEFIVYKSLPPPVSNSSFSVRSATPLVLDRCTSTI